MVQSQMTPPSYPPFSQPGIEDYQQQTAAATAGGATAIAAVSQAASLSADPQAQFKDPQAQQPAPSTTAVEQQTVSIEIVYW